LGHSVKPTVTTIAGACGLRIFWVLAIFPHYRTLNSLVVSYPVSWILTGAVNGIILFWVCRKLLTQARDSGQTLLHSR
ncbi:MAG: MATE family efflux transporter, partial [Lentisphaeria bacterium]|nr:MATE family efflux transporter [Lentisphaeria bacterium]